MDTVHPPIAAYLVDLMHSRSAEVLAAHLSVDFFLSFMGKNTTLKKNIWYFRAFRAFFLATAVSLIFPMIETYGLVVTNAVSALLAWLGFG